MGRGAKAEPDATSAAETRASRVIARWFKVSFRYIISAAFISLASPLAAGAQIVIDNVVIEMR